MEKREILQKIIDKYTNGNKRLFAKLVGTTPQNVSTWLKRNTFDADKILTNCEHISPSFLMTGEGEMLQSAEPPAATSSSLESLLQQMQQEVFENNKMMRDQMKSMQALMAETVQLMRKSQEYYERALELASQPQDAPPSYFPLTNSYLAENHLNVSPPTPDDA